MSNYKDTLLLPRTDFPMKANLTQCEPKRLAWWEAVGAYDQMVQAGGERGDYVLHDGPPYANGHIHMGTALNKVLKDIIVKSRNMAGWHAEYVPGWDCHGLPIEHKVTQEFKAKGKTNLPTLVVRKVCRQYAQKWLDVQRNEFKRLGVLGAWDNPYMTMRPAYEAATARELGRFMARGSVVRGKKPVHWCCDCGTALAEAEVEYADHTSPSVYVRFPLTDPGVAQWLPGVDPAHIFVVIWTTTPWTLPDNMAVALHPDFDYVFVKSGEDHYLLARELLAACAGLFGWNNFQVEAEVRGAELEGLRARHPFYDRVSPIVLADYVTLDAGSGCVHTAPGHGREDYDTGMRYGLEVLSPLDGAGCFLPDVPIFAGMNVFDANPKVIELLKERGSLLAERKITHSYPHCWRCKKPVIFRATTQWFISMDANGLRTKSLDAIRNRVGWLPSWGEERIYRMIENRPDWCISRQRSWGVPIPALLCQSCGEAWFDADWVSRIVDHFETHPTGCDWWFEADLKDVVPEGLVCPHCGRPGPWAKEDDILDVWFDSGTSFSAVLEQRPECHFPADLYLEGSDQHRGWFHSSLLAAMGTRGEPPYRNVLTHGYVVDAQGRKMSKSIGNVMAPQKIIDQYGAEILRMWVAAVNYQEDVRISDEILSRLVDAYRRIRNTCKFLLSNLWDFTLADAVATDGLPPLDRFALDLVTRAHQTMLQAYQDFEFHKVYHTLHNLCVTDLSAFYLDVIKDRLYVEEKNSLKRRAAQSVLFETLRMLLLDMAPILSFTAEEVFEHMPAALRPNLPTVFALREAALPPAMNAELRGRLERLLTVRAEVTKAIEPKRKDKVIGKSLDAQVTLYAEPELFAALRAAEVDLDEFFIVSAVVLEPLESAPADLPRSEELPGLAVSVAQAPGEKCARCWRYDAHLGADPNAPDVCPRCAAVLAAR